MTTLTGTPRNDVIHGTTTADTISGFAGNDRLYGSSGDDFVVGGDWSQTTGTGNDWLFGENGNDFLYGWDGNDRLFGGDGDDFLDGGDGNDVFDGGAGNDGFFLGAGNDRADGGAGDDSFGLFGDSGRKFIDGGDGEDWLTVYGAVTNLATGEVVSDVGRARVSGIENVQGGSTSDIFIGNSGANFFNGHGGDLLRGGDIFVGAGGNDTLQSGDIGDDKFVFDTAPSADNVDTIINFSSWRFANDELLFDDEVFASLGSEDAWADGDERFYAAAGATSGHDANDRLVYNTTTGDLYYDADGSGAEVALQVASLQGAPTLAASDITVI